MKQGPFPSPSVLLSARLKRYYEPLRHPPGQTRLRGATAYTRPSLPEHTSAGSGPGRASPVPASTIATVPLPLPRRVHRRCTPGSPRLPWPSPSTPGSAPPLQTNGAAGFASRYGPDRSHVPTGRLTLGSDAGRFPPTPPACYPASWHLPGPDSHRQANASLRPDQITECNTSELWAHDGAFVEPSGRKQW